MRTATAIACVFVLLSATRAAPAVVLDVMLSAPDGVTPGAIVSYTIALNDGVRLLDLTPENATIEHIRADHACIYRDDVLNGWRCFFLTDAQIITVHARVSDVYAPCGNAIRITLTANIDKGSEQLYTPYDTPGMCRVYIPHV